MTWDVLKKEPEVPTVEWRPARDVVHEQGFKILVWGDTEVGKEKL